ncbi:MAG: hypothetical protein A2705_04910 [Omnitrophica WOR_2 bacterium RIFCSPHIGHO2_01_FULL_52_10]|nr:MAG: hypothetical protein A2705_04910 [Omnitrophica WOR_2 bacterium RIFCSPHIGHO2_01_FULL_52_10]
MIKPIGGLDKNLLEGVVRIITSHKKVDKIILYGSRAGERFKRASDIDLAIAGTRWTQDDIAIVKFNLDTLLPTALKFDVVLLDALKKQGLVDDIREEGVVIYPAIERLHGSKAR